MDRNSKIYVAGHRGLVGSALVRHLFNLGFKNVIMRTSNELDLRNQLEVDNFFSNERPDYVLLAAAKVGGIYANDAYPAEFIYDNLMIQSNVISAARKHNVKKLMFLGSSCIYPKFAEQPMKEDALLTGSLEGTNEAYAVAKIAGLKLCEFFNKQYKTNFMAVMPTNLYGPNDNFDLMTSHVLPALLRKFHTAKVTGEQNVLVWGTGKPKREFLHVDDLAAAVVYLMQNYDASEIGNFVNVGTGVELTIAELAQTIKDVVGYEGEIIFDHIMPDGTPRKLLDVRKMEKLGWRSSISLQQGIRDTYHWCLGNNVFHSEELVK